MHLLSIIHPPRKPDVLSFHVTVARVPKVLLNWSITFLSSESQGRLGRRPGLWSRGLPFGFFHHNEESQSSVNQRVHWLLDQGGFSTHCSKVISRKVWTTPTSPTHWKRLEEALWPKAFLGGYRCKETLCILSQNGFSWKPRDELPIQLIRCVHDLWLHSCVSTRTGIARKNGTLNAFTDNNGRPRYFLSVVP